ncbi:DNA mismatch repair protein MutT [Rhizocola hellebori]|uniref:DNA mismatch repair protein MutT n=1 Tax=Rhizocola hellebori TaxID=1392758 RepID=A0A8J3Q9R7_9ACTN|nr:NUDIX domain-containing protein [Rhizocola hellebori]GIH05660.1 DNA mismatch repair protein MutT [Rhizocola hellebori]
MASPIDKVAWILVRSGKLLSSRNHGIDIFYMPGGRRERGESDLDTLLREVKEELTVDIATDTVQHIGTFTAQAHAQPEGVLCVMACYSADYTGELAASSEIAEIAWLGYADRDRVSGVDREVMEHLHAHGLLG